MAAPSTALALLMISAAAAAEPSLPAPSATAAAGIAAAPSATTGWTMPAEELAAIDAIIETAIAAGLPDARGAAFFTGEIDWKDDGHRGTHLRFADGRWLVALRFVAPADEIEATGASPLPASVLAALGQPEHGRSPGFNVDQVLKRFAPVDQPRLRASLPYLNGDLMDVPSAILHCRRAGVPGVELALALAAASASRPEWDDDGIVFFPRRQRHRSPVPEAAPPTLPPLPTGPEIARRICRDHVEAPLFDDASDAAARARAVAGSLSLVDAAQRPAAERRLAGLVARASLTPPTSAKDPLATRLAWWEPYPNRSDEGPGRQVTAEDLPGLIGLLEDGRPSRWANVDPAGAWEARPLGDNAVRAVSHLLRMNPGTLVGRDTESEWTATEREATVAALRSWWEPRQSRTLEQLHQELAPKYPLVVLSGLVSQRKDEAARTALLDAAVGAWAETPPHPEDAYHLAKLLVTADSHQGLTAFARSGRGDGDLALVLATWAALRGDRDRLDGLLDASLAAPGPPSVSVVITAMQVPDALRWQRLRQLLTGDPDAPARALVVAAVMEGNAYGAPWPLLDAYNDLRRTRMAEAAAGDGPGDAPGKDLGNAVFAGRSYLLLSLLGDRRPVPAGIVSTDGRWAVATLGDTKVRLDHGAKPLPADLRWCDLTAAALAMNERVEAPFDLRAATAQRDAQLLHLHVQYTAKARSDLAAAQIELDLPTDDPESLY